jgi:hypothetical protein
LRPTSRHPRHGYGEALFRMVKCNLVEHLSSLRQRNREIVPLYPRPNMVSDQNGLAQAHPLTPNAMLSRAGHKARASEESVPASA